MQISEYNDLLREYNAAWTVVSDLRAHVQQADTYLSAYGVAHHASELRFQINPRAHIDPLGWPSAAEILETVAALKEIGERVVSGYNRLKKEDRYLVKLPGLLK